MKTKLLLMLLAIALVAGAAQANMLVNSSFEDGAFGVNVSPDDWEHWWTYYFPVHTWMSNGAEAHSGSKYMKMHNWVAYGDDSTAYLGQTLPGVKERKDYSFSVWAKNGAEDQINLVGVEIEWRNAFEDLIGIEEVIGYDVVEVIITDPNWIEVDFGTFTAPEGTVAATVWLAAPLANGTNAICYDDVSMLGDDPNINAGADMISWDGEALSLTGTTSLDSYSTITWSAEPDYGAAITNGNTLTPTVDVDCIIPSGAATIANHSFENGLDDWEILSGEGHGTWIGAAATQDANGITIYITPTDGRQCAYLDGVTDGAGWLSQVLANNLVAANTTYTLSVDVANDGYYEEEVGYRVQLRAGESILKQDNDGHALDTYGEWKTSIVTYESGAEPTELGEPLEIRLIAKAGTARMNFDNIRLTADPEFGAYVPDMLTIKLTLDIDGKYDTMKIDVYPDACAAKLGAGLRETTDLVGDDCITNLPDLAEMVKTWPDHNALTAPQAKEGQEYEGEPIYIANPGFEVPVMADGDYSYSDVFDANDNWLALNGIDDAGVWNPDPDGAVWYGYGGIVPEGENCGFVSAYSVTEAAIIQTLTETLEAYTNYTLSLQVGNNNYYTGGIYTIEIMAGGTSLASLSENTEIIAYDEFEPRAFTYNYHPDHEALVGQPLEIKMSIARTPPDGVAELDVDDVTLHSENAMKPSPADGAYVPRTDERELSWTNIDPNKPGDPVYVDVWFGTEPNELNEAYDMTKIVDAVEDEDSVTVDANDLGTYYWQVNTYVYGSPTGDPAEGAMWEFHVVSDAPVSVNAGLDMITWSGQAVQLAPTVDDDGVPTLAWSADPSDGVVFTPNDGGDGSTSSAENPTVTITKVTDNPSVVTLTLSAQDDVSFDEDTMTIDVYDTSCLAAIGEGHEYDPGDFDVDCDTDLEDYATMAEQWLVNNELTESIVKP